MDRARTWLYEPAWRPAAAQEPPAAVGGRWLLVGARGRLRDELASGLQRLGATVAVADRGGEFAQRPDGSWTLDTTRRSDWERLVRESGMSGALGGVVSLLALDPEPGDGPSEGGGTLLTRSAVAQVQALSFAGGGLARRLWFLTGGCQPVRSPGDVTTASSACLWGLAKTVAFENPALECRVIDLEPGEVDVESLVVELAASSDEAEVAFRDGERFVRRLVPVAPDADGSMDEADRRPGDGHGSCLVTGGLGALGLRVAERLVERGFRHVVLAGRRPPSPTAARAIRRMGEQGAVVHVLETDVADEENLAQAVAELPEEARSFRGIVHAAGVLADGPLLSMPPEAVEDVLRPKAQGAWNVARLLGEGTGWISFFSSAAAVLGSPGQANYCAANAHLDALAALLRSRGVDVCSVAWGPWAAGMAVEAAGSEGRLQTGVALLDPERALDAMEGAIRAGVAHRVVLPFDLRDLVQFFPSAIGLPFFGEIVTDEDARLRSIGRGSVPEGRPELDVEYVEPRNELEERIAGLWQASLGIDRVGVLDGFFELGGDSVFANQIVVQINREFGVRIDAERAFEELSVAGLARLVEDALLVEVESLSEGEARRLVGDAAEPRKPAR